MGDFWVTENHSKNSESDVILRAIFKGENHKREFANDSLVGLLGLDCTRNGSG